MSTNLRTQGLGYHPSRIGRLVDYGGAAAKLAWALLKTSFSLSLPDVKDMLPNLLRSVAHSFAACAPFCLVYGWLVGLFTDQYIPHVAAPGLLVQKSIAPISVFIAGFIFIQRDGVSQAETYAVDTRENGFQFLLDIGLHPLNWIVVPRIISSALAMALLAPGTAVMILVGISPLTVLGFEIHPAISVGIIHQVFGACLQGFCFGVWFGYTAFIAGVVGDSRQPGAAAARYVAMAAYILSNVVLLELFPWK